MFGKKKPPEISDAVRLLMDKGPRAEIRTSKGAICLDLWVDIAPNHVANFLRLAQEGFWKGSLFHRLIPGFMIQGGCPNSKDPDKRALHGTGNAGYQLEAEFSDKPHERGVLSMARTGDPNSASCQFFVMVAHSPHLDNQYTAFGQVTEGLDVVDAIVDTARDRNGYPFEPTIIEDVVVID